MSFSHFVSLLFLPMVFSISLIVSSLFLSLSFSLLLSLSLWLKSREVPLHNYPVLPACLGRVASVPQAPEIQLDPSHQRQGGEGKVCWHHAKGLRNKGREAPTVTQKESTARHLRTSEHDETLNIID